jgi:hypothetical protein
MLSTVSGDSFDLNTSGIRLSYTSSNVGTLNYLRADNPSAYTFSLRSTNGSVLSDYALQPLNISSVPGAIIPIVTVVMPTIQPMVTAAAPTSSASTGGSGSTSGTESTPKSSSPASSTPGSSGASSSSSDAADDAPQQ